jgi:hypothetical protein
MQLSKPDFLAVIYCLYKEPFYSLIFSSTSNCLPHLSVLIPGPQVNFISISSASLSSHKSANWLWWIINIIHFTACFPCETSKIKSNLWREMTSCQRPGMEVEMEEKQTFGMGWLSVRALGWKWRWRSSRTMDEEGKRSDDWSLVWGGGWGNEKAGKNKTEHWETTFDKGWLAVSALGWKWR